MITIKRHAGLAALPESYAALFRECGQESVFFTETWFRNFEASVVRGAGSAVIYGVEDSDSGRPRAALLMWRCPRPSGLLAPAKLQGLANYYSCFFGPLVGEQESACEPLAAAFADALWADRGQWDVLELKPLDPAAPMFELLARALRSKGVPVETYFAFGNWYLEVAGRSFAQYLADLPSVLKKNIPYNSRRLDRSGGRTVVISGGAELEGGIRDYERVYAASWKKPEPYPDFMPNLMRAAAANGWLRLGLAYVNDEPAAAHVWLVHAGIASIFKIAYDERFAKLSVGAVLTARLMEHALDVDKVRIVDYLSGDDSYKRDWMSQRRERWGLAAINPRSVRGLALIARNWGSASREGVAAPQCSVGHHHTAGRSREVTPPRP